MKYIKEKLHQNKIAIKNIICYTIGVLCVLSGIAVMIFGSFSMEDRAFTLIKMFVLGLIAVIAMDQVDIKHK